MTDEATSEMPLAEKFRAVADVVEGAMGPTEETEPPPPTEAQLDKAVASARQKRADACWASIDEILKANRCELAGHPEYTGDGRTVVRFGVRAL